MRGMVLFPQSLGCLSLCPRSGCSRRHEEGETGRPAVQPAPTVCQLCALPGPVTGSWLRIATSRMLLERGEPGNLRCGTGRDSRAPKPQSRRAISPARRGSWGLGTQGGVSLTQGRPHPGSKQRNQRNKQITTAEARCGGPGRDPRSTAKMPAPWEQGDCTKTKEPRPTGRARCAGNRDCRASGHLGPNGH